MCFLWVHSFACRSNKASSSTRTHSHSHTRRWLLSSNAERERVLENQNNVCVRVLASIVKWILVFGIQFDFGLHIRGFNVYFCIISRYRLSLSYESIRIIRIPSKYPDLYHFTTIRHYVVDVQHALTLTLAHSHHSLIEFSIQNKTIEWPISIGVVRFQAQMVRFRDFYAIKLLSFAFDGRVRTRRKRKKRHECVPKNTHTHISKTFVEHHFYVSDTCTHQHQHAHNRLRINWKMQRGENDTTSRQILPQRWHQLQY